MQVLIFIWRHAVEMLFSWMEHSHSIIVFYFLSFEYLMPMHLKKDDQFPVCKRVIQKGDRKSLCVWCPGSLEYTAKVISVQRKFSRLLKTVHSMYHLHLHSRCVGMLPVKHTFFFNDMLAKSVLLVSYIFGVHGYASLDKLEIRQYKFT